MRRIALINQKGGVGKTTSTVNLGAALARQGRRVVLIDLDPQANLSLHLDCALRSGEPSVYTVLLGTTPLAKAIRPTSTPGLSLVGSNIDLSGAELELASAMGRESLLRDAVDAWEDDARAKTGAAPADYLLIDCPPSLGLLSVNGLVASKETIITLQTEFFALQGMSKLIDVVQLLRRRLNPALAVTGILPCLYDNRLRLAREVLGEIRKYFPGEVFKRPIAKNIKLAEAPSYGRTIFDYAPESSGASDYAALALEVIAQESRDAELAALQRPSDVPAKPARASGLRTVALTPAAADVEDAEGEEGEARAESPEAAAASERDRTLRAHELPPLPLDAFEIRHA
jgi:chromosome partitioning protein